MPTINLTNNTTLQITASTADGNATLNRYLTHPLTFLTPAGFDAIADQKIGAVDATPFPLTASATGAGTFALEKTSLNVQLGASAAIGLLKGSDISDFLGALQVPGNPAGLVSFGVTGTLSAGDTATTGDFSFGITKGATVSLSSYYAASADELLEDAVKQAMASLTILHDIQDLKSMPAGAVCQTDAASSLQFSASVTYNVLNDPLATKAISNLPTIAVNATAGATVEATVTHTSDHTVTVAKLANGLVHLSVSLTKTDDFETSLTASASLTVDLGKTDALALLLKTISPNSALEMAKIQAEMPAAAAQQYSSDVKAAIDAAVSNSLQVSLKAALDVSTSKNRVFLYEIDLGKLDDTSTTAVQSALGGDFTKITQPGAVLAGIREIDSAFTKTSTVQHSLAVHLLGIFNWDSTNTFIQKSKVDYTKDTHEIVLSDESIEIAIDNLSAVKLREVVVKGITLTLPASANTPANPTPIQMVYFDREGSASESNMTQFVNVLSAIQSTSAAGAKALLAKGLKNYGTTSLYLGLSLTPDASHRLFISGSNAFGWADYVQAVCSGQQVVLANDEANADRLKLYQMDLGFWKLLLEAGTLQNINALLKPKGIRSEAAADAIAVNWWSEAMSNYATALAEGKPLVNLGKAVVKDGTMGFNEPWMILAAWNVLGRPAMDSMFTSSLIQGLAAGTSS